MSMKDGGEGLLRFFDRADMYDAVAPLSRLRWLPAVVPTPPAPEQETKA